MISKDGGNEKEMFSRGHGGCLSRGSATRQRSLGKLEVIAGIDHTNVYVDGGMLRSTDNRTGCSISHPIDRSV